jgi:hypothetical protein
MEVVVRSRWYLSARRRRLGSSSADLKSRVKAPAPSALKPAAASVNSGWLCHWSSDRRVCPWTRLASNHAGSPRARVAATTPVPGRSWTVGRAPARTRRQAPVSPLASNFAPGQLHRVAGAARANSLLIIDPADARNSRSRRRSARRRPGRRYRSGQAGSLTRISNSEWEHSGYGSSTGMRRAALARFEKLPCEA